MRSAPGIAINAEARHVRGCRRAMVPAREEAGYLVLLWVHEGVDGVVVTVLGRARRRPRWGRVGEIPSGLQRGRETGPAGRGSGRMPPVLAAPADPA